MRVDIKMDATDEIVKEINEGKIVYLEKEIDTKTLDWNAHAVFQGVYLKHLVKGEDTDGKFSSHLVKVEAGCEIGEHVHEEQWELHEIMSGVGKGVIAEKEITYKLGVFGVIPKGIKHKVIATDTNLYLLAKFVPALF